jgi:hypothetical protein
VGHEAVLTVLYREGFKTGFVAVGIALAQFFAGAH